MLKEISHSTKFLLHSVHKETNLKQNPNAPESTDNGNLNGEPDEEKR